MGAYITLVYWPRRLHYRAVVWRRRKKEHSSSYVLPMPAECYLCIPALNYLLETMWHFGRPLRSAVVGPP